MIRGAFLEAPLITSMKKAVMRNGRGPLINLMVVAKVSATVITCIVYMWGLF